MWEKEGDTVSIYRDPLANYPRYYVLERAYGDEHSIITDRDLDPSGLERLAAHLRAEGWERWPL